MHNVIFRKYIWLLGVLLLGIAGDQATKYYVRELLSTVKRIAVCKFLTIAAAYNTGISWGLFSKAGKSFRWWFIGLSIGLIIMFLYMFYTEKRTSTQWAIALIISGACGNVWDRFWFGAVFDFLSLHWKSFYFPVFNVADILISVGFMILLRDYYKWNG